MGARVPGWAITLVAGEGVRLPTMAVVRGKQRSMSLEDTTPTEPEALIGFAGPRVIEQTIRWEATQGFQ